ncbi:TetR/AcrR family transcriptional regulator [Micromonospora sp. NPDC003197]
MESRQVRIADAAIRVLGERGLRQLTHRAVDAESGLPAGSTSNYFRTRDALLTGVVTRMTELDREVWQRFAGVIQPADIDELAGALGEFVRFATGPGRCQTLARLALFVEAGVRPELQQELVRGNREIIEWGIPWLRGIGSTDPAGHGRLLADYLDGVVLHGVAFPDTKTDPVPGIRLLLGGLVAADGG